MFSKKALGYERKCTINWLTNEKLEVAYSCHQTGQELFDDVANELSLVDKDYYGLRFHNQLHWLDLTKPLVKQTKDLSFVVFDLRFKYYPAEPVLLANESTRYYLYLQLRLDLIEGRLKSDFFTLAYLVACILQAELGDSIQDNAENYAVEFKFVPNQTEELELAAIEQHKSFRGLEPAESELNFLKKASLLVTYGIDPCPVKDGSTRNHFLIGVNYRGIATFQDSKFISQISWDEIDRITLDNKLVVVYCCRRDANGDKIAKSKTIFGFKCQSRAHADYFWKITNEHRFFFTLESTPESPIVTESGGFFKKNHKLKYGSRVERDLLRNQSLDDSQSSGVRRSCSLILKSNDESWSRELNSSAQSQNPHLTTEMINRSYMDHFEEEKEANDRVQDLMADHNSRQEDHRSIKNRNSICSIVKNPPKSFIRRSILVTKSDPPSTQSKHFSTAAKNDDDFIKTTVLMILIISTILMILLFLNETERPTSINLVVERLNLNYFIPFKSALSHFLAQVLPV